MDIFLWFDTEDYLLPASDDAALRLANMLTAEGVRATFKVVGEKARTLERRGRQDVIDALKRHEIGYHSNWHSVHPTPAQYLSALGWEEGVAEFMRREGPGVDDVTRIFGQHPSCYGQPGSSWGPQAFGAMRRLGIPVYLDAGNHVNLDQQPLWYNGILTVFSLEYTLRTGLEGKKDLKEAKEKFSAARQQVLSRGGGAVHIYYHPCEWVHQQFWDGVNFSNGANPPPEMWKLPAQQTPRQTETAFETFLAYLRWIKQQPGVRFLTPRDALTLYADRAQGRAFSVSELEQMAMAAGDSISFQRRGDFSLSPAELFTLLNARVADYGDQTKEEQSYGLPETVSGPSEPGPVLPGPQTTSWSQFQRTARDVRGYLSKHKQIPSTVWLGSTGVPPEAYLTALARVVPQLQQSNPPEMVEVRPAMLAATKYVAEDSEQLWGWLFPKGWHAPAMMQLAKRQAWTIKPAMRLRGQ